jgi:hypothetical protein
MIYLLIASGVALVIGIGLLRWIKTRRDERKRAESDPILLDGWDLPPK